MHQRLLSKDLPRHKSFCLLGADGVGKTTLIRDFAGKFSNWIHLDLTVESDRSIFRADSPAEETLKAVGFLKGKEIRGSGTLILLDEIGQCREAMDWVWDQADGRTGGRADGRTGPLIVATSSIRSEEIDQLVNPANGPMAAYFLHPFSFEEFLMVMDDPASLEAFREVPVPYYAYEKLLNYFHLYALIGGMPEITSEYASSGNLSALKKIYEQAEERLIQHLPLVTGGNKSQELAMEVLQNSYPFAATRISFNRFGNIEKGSREISRSLQSLQQARLLQLIYPVTSPTLPVEPDKSKFPRLQLLDTGLVNYFSGIQKPLFQSHDMNAIFKGQIARQVVGQELLATQHLKHTDATQLSFWVRNKAQSGAEVDFVIRYNDLLIPVVVRSGEPGHLRSLHQFMDIAPHPYAVRLYAEKLSVQQTRTLSGRKYYLLNLPYFLAGKIRDHLEGFMKYVEG
ncbi:MAG: ATP-binding protein [Bacteroidales bacterium]